MFVFYFVPYNNDFYCCCFLLLLFNILFYLFILFYPDNNDFFLPSFSSDNQSKTKTADGTEIAEDLDEGSELFSFLLSLTRDLNISTKEGKWKEWKALHKQPQTHLPNEPKNEWEKMNPKLISFMFCNCGKCVKHRFP